MSADHSRRDGSTWPAWLENLRPDPLSRRRIRAAVMERARPLLARRRPAGTWEVAAGWSDVVIPVAAVASVLFTLLAVRASPGTPGGVAEAQPESVRIEELLAEPSPGDPPTVLTRGNRPDLDGVLEAALTYYPDR